MKDCELFNVGSTEIWSVVISISSIICVYLAMSNKDGVKSFTKEVIVMGVHKTSNKERVDVKNIKDRGVVWARYSAPQMILTMRFCICREAYLN